MADGSPVGVFDSGVGGLSVLREIRALLPHEALLYVADSAHIPYGEKSQAFIRERLVRIAEFFHARGAKALVLACNTATVAAVADLRARYPHWLIIGMEPAVKPAAAATHNGRVGVLATTGTLQSATFAALLDRFAADVKVFAQPCPGLVERVEAADLNSPVTRELLRGFLAPLLAADCDTLILGCTHYPFLKPLLGELLPASISVIDTGAAVARHLQRLLAQADRLATGAPEGARFWTSGAIEAFAEVLPVLWGEAADVQAFTA